jgi:hypothetical protein
VSSRTWFRQFREVILAATVHNIKRSITPETPFVRGFNRAVRHSSICRQAPTAGLSLTRPVALRRHHFSIVFLLGTVSNRQLAVLSPLFADALTPMGVRPLEPRDDRELCYDGARASNPVANYGLLVLGGAVALVFFALASAIAQ